jgi:hypothetical protein
LVGHGRRVPRVRWPGEARVAVGFVLNQEEGSEYSHPAGDRRNGGLQEVVYAMDPEHREWQAQRLRKLRQWQPCAVAAGACRLLGGRAL